MCLLIVVDNCDYATALVVWLCCEWSERFQCFRQAADFVCPMMPVYMLVLHANLSLKRFYEL